MYLILGYPARPARLAQPDREAIVLFMLALLLDRLGSLLLRRFGRLRDDRSGLGVDLHFGDVPGLRLGNVE